jgi:hypothetical protein
MTGRTSLVPADGGPLKSAAGVVPSAWASAASLRTEMFPSPDSTWTRKRADRPERPASSLSVSPGVRAQRACAPPQGLKQPVVVLHR